MPTPALPAFLSYADADARLGGALSVVFEGAGASPGGYDKVLFFDGDLTLDGDFLYAVDELLGGDVEGRLELIVVTGDLTVNGPIALYDDRPGLYVGGRTEAETLEGGEAEIHIHDGTFTYLVHGYHNHGSLTTGVIDTPWVIDDDHHMDVGAPGARSTGGTAGATSSSPNTSPGSGRSAGCGPSTCPATSSKTCRRSSTPSPIWWRPTSETTRCPRRSATGSPPRTRPPGSTSGPSPGRRRHRAGSSELAPPRHPSRTRKSPAHDPTTAPHT